MAHIPDDMAELPVAKLPDKGKENDDPDISCDPKYKKHNSKRISGIGINTRKLVATCIIRHNQNEHESTSDSSKDEINVNTSPSHDNNEEEICEDNVSQTVSDPKENHADKDSNCTCSVASVDSEDIESKLYNISSCPKMEDIKMYDLSLNAFSEQSMWTKMEQLMEIWQEIAVTYQNVENFDAKHFKRFILTREWAFDRNRLLYMNDIEVDDIDVDMPEYERPTLDELLFRGLTTTTETVDDFLSTHQISEDHSPHNEAHSSTNCCKIGESSTSVNNEQEITVDIHDSMENITSDKESEKSATSNILEKEVKETELADLFDDEIEKGKDEAAYEMIVQLNAFGGQVIHSALVKPAVYQFPEPYRAKFKYLRSLLLDNFPNIANEINQYNSKNISSHLPTRGSWVSDADCAICCRNFGMFTRSCCNTPICESCLRDYFLIMIEQEGRLEISCLNCSSLFLREEIFCRISIATRKKYDLFYLNKSQTKTEKACPRCCLFTKMTPEMRTAAVAQRKKTRRKRDGINVDCSSCGLSWCFDCHMPNHQGVSCKEQRAGDKKLKTWAEESTFNGKKARRCPKCRIMTERTEGCPHMTCNQCDANWCYNCGKRRIHLKLLGDHDKRFSIFGCSKILFPKCGFARWLVRCSILIGGVILLPPLTVAAGGIAIALIPLGLIGFVGFLIYRAAKKN